MSSRSRRKPERPAHIARATWRAMRRAPGPIDHETGEGAIENDPSMTKQMRHSLHRVYWNLRGEIPPLMDQDGRPLDLEV